MINIDGSIIILVLSILVSVGLFCYIVYRFMKKPGLLKTPSYHLKKTEDPTTINWGIVQSITLAVITFGVGVYTIGGVIIFLFYKELIIDGLSIGLMAIVFLYFILKELDKFMTKYLRK